MKQNKQVNLLSDLYPCNQKLQGPKMVSNGCSGNIKALNLQYVSHCFFINIKKNARKWSKVKMQKNEARNHFKTHASWLLIAQKGCFFWKQIIATTVIGNKILQGQCSILM